MHVVLWFTTILLSIMRTKKLLQHYKLDAKPEMGNPTVFYNYGTLLCHSRVCNVYEITTKMKMPNTHYWEDVHCQ
jgi:hypothetical protein